MPGLKAVIAAVGGILLLAGCQDSSGTHVGSGTPAPSSSEPSAYAAVPTGTSSNGPATTTPTSPVTTTHTPTPSHTAAAPARAASPTPVGILPTSANHPDCRNLTADSEVKAAVTEAYRRSFPRFIHIQPVPRQFFYGQCGGVRYAATRFEATPGASHDELVGMQDEGSATKYFRSTSGGGWTYLTSDGFPRGPQGCGDVVQIPRALSEIWGNCPVVQ
jgi:hypothetical protein